MRTALALLTPLALAPACSPVPGECGVSKDEPHVVVLNRLALGREVDGQSMGFDLDGQVTTEGGADGCGIGDYQGFDGRAGVDNALARLIPVLELTEAVALEDLAQLAVNQGELLIMVQLDHLDSYAQDECVDLTLFRGEGVPTIGTYGVIEPGQTFDADPGPIIVNA